MYQAASGRQRVRQVAPEDTSDAAPERVRRPEYGAGWYHVQPDGAAFHTSSCS
jgi:hypothetical protein